MADAPAPVAAGLEGNLVGRVVYSMYREQPAHSFNFKLSAEGKIEGTLLIAGTEVGYNDDSALAAAHSCQGTFTSRTAGAGHQELHASLQCTNPVGTEQAIELEILSSTINNSAAAAFKKGLATLRFWAKTEAPSEELYTIAVELK